MVHFVQMKGAGVRWILRSGALALAVTMCVVVTSVISAEALENGVTAGFQVISAAYFKPENLITQSHV